MQQYYADTSDNWQSQIIVWPEAAIPTFPENIPSFIDKLNQEAKAHHTTIISGIPLAQFDAINNKTELLQRHRQFWRKATLLLQTPPCPIWRIHTTTKDLSMVYATFNHSDV